MPTAQTEKQNSKITLNISVGYNCREWLINTAEHLWDACSIRSVGQCVFQQIELGYFPWCLYQSVLPAPSLIGCTARLRWCASVITPESYQSEEGTHSTCDPCPLTQDEPQLIRWKFPKYLLKSAYCSPEWNLWSLTHTLSGPWCSEVNYGPHSWDTDGCSQISSYTMTGLLLGN